ncbi:hypothetical protein vBValMR10Z_299 [Vibrio phage vB_ValM_R10Z]|nr:hypothetical protein Va3_261 [Vibrio phage Va3]QNJ54839.1 hypothetical protein vBValMR10Z_299 [Vibrio phage vB_ValM_R10Z]QNJ55226.1 hypothetical protein vBValMR11Z_300 [Vibrio phage vB_ValM_R11Z]URQ03461.1 hypothetical protein PVA23_84 [Vibrio phage PVA23]
MKSQEEFARQAMRVRAAVRLFDPVISFQEALNDDLSHRGQRVMSALPDNIQYMWQKRDEMNEKILAEISCIEKRIDKTLCEINDPLHAIGKDVVKKSGKPFKGGQDIVRVTGITKHPYTEGYAFTYNYSEDNGQLAQSYIHTSMVIINYSSLKL